MPVREGLRMILGKHEGALKILDQQVPTYKTKALLSAAFGEGLIVGKLKMKAEDEEAN